VNALAVPRLGLTWFVEMQVCGSSWPSKSKLFKHIKQTGHAALKPL